MGFKVFREYGAASRPEATLRASGYLFLSKGILKRAGCEGATHAQLSFDEEQKKLGVQLFDSPDHVEDESVREMAAEKSGGAINLLPLLRYYAYPKPTKKYVFPVKFQDQFIVIDVGELKPASSAEGPEY